MASEKKKLALKAYKRGYVVGFREAEKNSRDKPRWNGVGYSRGFKASRKIKKIERKVKKYESDIRGF